jgi:hypothetical protein
MPSRKIRRKTSLIVSTYDWALLNGSVASYHDWLMGTANKFDLVFWKLFSLRKGFTGQQIWLGDFGNCFHTGKDL